MFYWFMRGQDSLRYEVREISSKHFELTIKEPGGGERVECFETADALHRRQLMLERELRAQGWIGPRGWNV